MIVKITLDGGLTTTYGYKSALLGFFYSTVREYFKNDPRASKFISNFHDATMVKFSAMSDIIGRYRVERRGERVFLTIEDDPVLFISNAFDVLLEPFLYIDHLRIGPLKVPVKKVETVAWRRTEKFRLISPANVTEITRKEGKKFYRTLHPTDDWEKYSDLVARNLAKKYVGLGGEIESFEDFMKMFPFTISDVRSGLFYMKNKKTGRAVPVRGYYYTIEFDSMDDILMKVITEAGIGFTNLAGFGFAVPYDEYLWLMKLYSGTRFKSGVNTNTPVRRNAAVRKGAVTDGSW